MLSGVETIGIERAKPANFWAKPEALKSAGTLGNPRKHAGIGEKNPTGLRVGFCVWWCSTDLGSNSLLGQVRKPEGVCPSFAEFGRFAL